MILDNLETMFRDSRPASATDVPDSVLCPPSAQVMYVRVIFPQVDRADGEAADGKSACGLLRHPGL